MEQVERMSWLGAGVDFCVTCAAERPTIKRGKVRICVTCKDPVAPRPSKYANKPTRSKHTGRVFQSKREANREPVLLALQNSGQITDLKYQVPFRLELYGTQAVDAVLELVERLPGEQSEGFPAWASRVMDALPYLLAAARDVRRTRQCVAVYKADFTYRTKGGTLVVEDPKGYVKPEYRMKKKLMVLAHNVEIQEPGEGGVQQRARGCGIRGRGTGARLMGGR